MYCFPYPQASDVTPIRVPYIATSTYSLAGPYTFDNFYEVAVFAKALQAVRDIPTPSRHSLASIIQSWLFFGLASEVLGRDIKHDEFIEKYAIDASEASIDLRIPKWFWTELKGRWDNLQTTISANEYEQKKEKILRCCNLALKRVCYLDIQEKKSARELDLVLLSVHMLLYLIAALFGSMDILQTSLQCNSAQVLIQRMLKNGWCRKRLNFVKVIPVFYPALYFMSSFRPPQGDAGDHRLCTAAKCSIAKGLLDPGHRTADCQCQDVHVPLEQVTGIVAAGGIPLIRITRAASGDLILEVVPYRRTSLFIAVSHVWADRQLGSTKNALPKCQVEYLDSVLAALPRLVEHRRLHDWLPKKFSLSSPMGVIEPPSRTYQLFWLDTFCIPQDAQHADLKCKAIESMNLIYAAASKTLVFDAGLQKFDAGQQPSSLVRFSQPTFYGPTDRKLLDVLAHICASNWMGRAWTLQEGVLSGHLVFPLEGSLAYLRLLRRSPDSGSLLLEPPLLRRLRDFFKKDRASESTDPPLPRARDEADPLRDCVHENLFEFTKASLNVEEHGNYARGRTDRAARFVQSHSLLQSRTTTQPEDLPLILINMSGMNGNSVSQTKSTAQRMKLLFYGLETLPAELLFSECERIDRCKVDSWIPREIVPERFYGEHTLQLGPEGFTFHQLKGHQRLEFFLLPSSVVWQGQVLLLLYGKRDHTKTKYLVKTPTSATEQSCSTSKNGWCVLIDDDSFNPRAARFVISRINGNKVFLHFDCPLRLSSSHTDNPEIREQIFSNVGFAQPANTLQEFIIEKSSTPQSLGLSRPQNPEQYSDRLTVINPILYLGLSCLAQYFMDKSLDDRVLNSTFFLVAWGIFSFKLHEWVERAVHAFVHHAWVETYQPTWNSNGWLKWFWKLSNYEPPIPFRTMAKYLCQCLFFLSLITHDYSAMLRVTLYWCPLYPRQELVNMFKTALVYRALSWLLSGKI